MKTPVLCLVLALAAVSAGAAEVVPGNSLEEAIAALGSPRGRLQVGDRNLVYYERGEIEMQGGRVTRVALRTPEEHALLLAREERQRGEREVRRNQLIAAGTVERDRKLADENFRAAPLAYQVSYWQDFARRYPDVSVVEPLAIARLKYNEQLEERQRKDRTAQLEAELLEQKLAAEKSRPEVYPLYTGSPYYRYRHYYSPGLGPITYTFYSSPLPPYTTPSGNPAGNLSGPVVNFPATNPALPDRWDEPRARSDRGDRSRRDHDNGSYRRFDERS